MKRERRQELKSNELSVQLQKFSEYIQQRASTLIAIGVGVILVVAALAYRNHAATAAQAQGWAQYYDALLTIDRSSPQWVDELSSSYEDIIEVYGDRELRIQAGRGIVELCLAEATKNATDERKKDLIDTAERHARQLLEQAGKNVPLKAAALNWLATIEQDRFAMDDDPAHKEAARGYLERIRDDSDFTGWTAFQADALQRLNDFESLWEPVVLADPPPPPVPAPALDVDLPDDSSAVEPDGTTDQPPEFEDDSAGGSEDDAALEDPPASEGTEAAEPPDASDDDD